MSKFTNLLLRYLPRPAVVLLVALGQMAAILIAITLAIITPYAIGSLIIPKGYKHWELWLVGLIIIVVLCILIGFIYAMYDIANSNVPKRKEIDNEN